MNKIILKGTIKNIQYSHNINDIEFYKADLITKPRNGIEYSIPIKFKRFCNKYSDEQNVELVGNLRSYSFKENNKNHVSLYVFTYQDNLDNELDELQEQTNYFKIDGRICKKDFLKINNKGKCSISFILANNLSINNDENRLNSYLPCISFGKTAKHLNILSVGDKITIEGYIRSREYRKKISDDNYEIRVAHELVVTSIKEPE